MDLASPSSTSGPSVPSGSNSGLLSPATVRFRMLVSHFMSPAEEAKLLGYKDGEVQLELSPPNKTPMFIVLIDGAREEERSLRLRLGRFATEKVDNQHVVVVGNQGWMADAMRKLAEEFGKISLYLLNSEGEIELKGKSALPPLMSALKAQRKRQLPVAGVPVFTGATTDSGLASESEADFATRCARAEETKARLREEYADLLKLRLPAITIALVGVQGVLLGLTRYFQKSSDNATALVQMGAAVPPFIKEGEWWRLLASAELYTGVSSGVLGLLVLLSLGTLLEKLLGSARFMILHVVAALGAAILGLLWPRGTAMLISIGAPATACALLGAGAVLALDPGGLPPAEVQRLRKIAISGLIVTALLTFIPGLGVDRPTQLGGLIVGAVLMASGLLRPPPLGPDGKQVEAPIVVWLQLGGALLCGLLLLASLGLAMLNGHPWHADTSWKKRLSAAKKDSGSNPIAALVDPGKKDDAAAAGGDAPVRRPLGDSGASVELPKGLGEAQLKGDPGHTPVYEFGDLGENQQQLSVLVQAHPRQLKGKMLNEAFEQAVVQIKADKLRDDRTSVIKPPEKSMLDGFPVMELHVRMQETVQARGLVQTRSGHTIVLWYVYTDLLPEAAQLDLKQVLKSVREGEGPPSKGKDKKKKRR